MSRPWRLRIPLLVAVAVVGQSSTAPTLANPNLPGLVQEGTYAPQNLGLLMQPAPNDGDAGPVYNVGAWPTSTPPLAEGKGKELVQSFCAICHSTTYITMQPPLPSATWEAVVNKMVGTFGAPIPQAATQEIIAYLKAHYTPETRKD